MSEVKEKTIFEALRHIQNELNAPKNLKNNFGNYSYRSAEGIYESIKPLLKKYECTLTLNDDIVLVGDRHYIKATATLTDKQGNTHSVSAFARETLVKKGMDEAQITGSASSYARKYALGGLFLLDDNKDIDSQDNTQAHTEQDKPKIKKDNNSVSLIMQTLQGIGLSMQDIKQFMEASNYKSKDTQVMDYLANNLDKLKAEAEAFMKNAVENGIRN